MKDQINTVTNCPTCGCECTIQGEETHYYVPKKPEMPSDKEIEKESLGEEGWDMQIGFEHGSKWMRDLISKQLEK